MNEPQILLTNDDGIASPGIWAAAKALSQIGYVHVVAPRDQFSGAGRSLPSNSDGIITTHIMPVDGKDWTTYSVGGSPAQAVLHALLEILPVRPDLVVSGINFGENVGQGVTVSGTVGAALEAAAQGIPAMAVSLETEKAYHYSISNQVDFSAAAYFTTLFGRILLERSLPEDVLVLKVDVPSSATSETPWQVTRLSRQNYFVPTKPLRASWNQPESVGYARSCEPEKDPQDTDVYALGIQKHVSVTPLGISKQ